MNKKGFTLIELLLVIMILGLLATLLAGNFFTSLKKGRDARRKADLNQIQKALELYYEDKRAYPATLSFGSKLCETEACDPSEKVYMQKVPSDPTNIEYGYETDTNGTLYRLYACLENEQQILPYESTNVDSYTCERECKNTSDANVDCIFGISSTNTNP